MMKAIQIRRNNKFDLFIFFVFILIYTGTARIFTYDLF